MNVGHEVALGPVRAAVVGAEDSSAALRAALGESGVAGAALRGLRQLSSGALRAVEGEVAAVLDGLLDLDLGDALVMGWRKHAALRTAAERTLATPASQEIVALATHRITWRAEPAIDLFVEDVRVTTLDVGLSIMAEVLGLTAIVRAGHLIGLRGGECILDGTLTLEGGVLVERRQHLDLSHTLRLHHAVRLAAPPPPAPGSPVPDGIARDPSPS